MTPPPLQPPRASARRLAIEDARAIAMQWKDALRDKVRLERTPDESVGVAKSYVWIRFEIDTSDRSKVSAARAVAVTWFALSCCPGYGGRENPAFWKNVFSEMVFLYVGRPEADESISDAYGFFDGDDMDFPRFKLGSFGNEANLLLFCGAPGEELEANDKAKLAQIMETLAPWIDQERTTRRPKVSLEGMHSSYLLVKRNDITKLESQHPQEWPLSRFISESNRCTGSGWPSPMFVVKELDIDSASLCGQSMMQQWFRERIHRLNIEIREFACNINTATPRDALATIVRDVLRLPGSDVRAHTTVFSSNLQAQALLPAFASALPHTTSIKAVRIVNNYRSNETDAHPSIVWIAYALFHPDTATTPWKSLILRTAGLREQSVAALQAMARGNNLMAMLEGREPTSDGYYRARLALNAIVYDQHGSSTTEQSTQTALVRSDGNLEVEVCDVASENPTQWSKWVAVIVPTYGLGWVRSAAVASVLKRAPAEASISRLKMSASSRRVSRDPNTLGRVLSVIGRRLVHLDIGWYAKFACSADLVQALSCCPSLESLAIQYDIDVWDSEAVARVLHHLRELELSLQQTHLAAFDVPPSLHLLRINAVRSFAAYGSSGDAIRHILMQPSSQLRVFHWRDGYAALYIPKRYSATCRETEQRLEALDVPRKYAEYVDTRLPASCAAAFLSVISQPVQGSAMARLDKWMSMSIVEFAGSKTTRAVVIEPTMQEVVVAPHYFDPRVAH